MVNPTRSRPCDYNSSITKANSSHDPCWCTDRSSRNCGTFNVRKKIMSTPETKNISFAAPVVVMLFMWKFPHGVPQTAATVAGAMVTIALIPLLARYAWTPVFKNGGLLWATLLLVFALFAGLVATTVGSALKFVDLGSFTGDLVLRCSVALMLCSWGLAAFPLAKDSEPNQALQPM